MKFIYAIVALVFVCSGYIYASGKEPKYSRQECIQQVVFNWEGYSQSEIERTINNISRVLREAWSEKSDAGIDVPAYTFPFNQRDEWYLQYQDECHEKKNKTIWLIKNVLEPKLERLPVYEVTDKLIAPSPKTISVTGESWKKDEFE